MTPGRSPRRGGTWTRGRGWCIVRAGLRRLDCPAHGVRGRGRAVRPAPRPGSPATSRTSPRSWPPGPTRPRSPGSCASTGTPSGASASGSSPTAWTPPAWTAWSRRGRRGVLAKRHNYLTLVTDHDRKKVVWGKAGQGHRHPRRVLRRTRPELAPGGSRRSAWTWARRSPSAYAPTATPRRHICYRPVPRGQARHRRPGRRCAAGLERAARSHRPRRREEVQGRPLGAAQTTPTDLDRRPGRARCASSRRRGGGPLAGLHPQGGLPGDLLRRPDHRRGRRPDRPVDLQGQPVPATPRSSRPPRPSASTATGSSPPSD